MATPEQTSALAAALRGQQRPTTSDMGVYGLVTSPDEEDARMQAAAMAQALRGQRAAGHLGLLTGDKVLSNFGQAQMQGADRQEAMLADVGQQRSSNVLKQALAAEEAKRQNRLDTERERHNRTMEGRPPSNVFLQGPGGQYFMAPSRGTEPPKPVADPTTGDPLFSPKADDLKTAEEKAATDAANKTTERESGIRKEFQALEEVRTLPGIESAHRNLIAAQSDMTGFGATTMIFNIMKMLDPGVSVMQGDIDLVKKAGGPLARYANLYEEAKSGNPLTPEVRADIVRSANLILSSKRKAAEDKAAEYSALAGEYGLDPKRVILSPGLRGTDPESGSESHPGTGASSPQGAPSGLKSSTRPTTPLRTPMPAGELGAPPTQEAGGGVVTEAMGRGFRPLNMDMPPFTVNPEKMRPRSGGIYMFNPQGAAFFVKDAAIEKARSKGWKDAQ